MKGANCMNCNDTHKNIFGNTRLSCIYDSATFLAMLLDTVVLDQNSAFYQELCALRNAAFDSLPEKVVFSFPKNA